MRLKMSLTKLADTGVGVHLPLRLVNVDGAGGPLLLEFLISF